MNRLKLHNGVTQIEVESKPFSVLRVEQWHDGLLEEKQDCLAEETPVAIVYNGVSHAVMLATAEDLEDFALGFSLSEEILSDANELYGVEVNIRHNGIELHCEIASERFAQLKERRRTLAGKTGCGLCGAENLAQAMRYPKPISVNHTFASKRILLGLQAIKTQQALQQTTGATHASAYVLADGTIALLREDVGRHNALDKLVGALAKSTLDKTGFILTTSRASFEMVQKTATAGVGMLVAVSAPTGLAVRVAKVCGLALVGFARENRYVVYSHPELIQHESIKT
ncbi:MAG TPA: formate dehydrogenase accessory sulfurtransferase FdhD [Methylotenera sp.]|nr:formate dehydrogenase accessory sulfurtransferase FdhD [Methylotenera sp.]